MNDSKGNIIAGIEVVRDITKRKSIEEELNRLATTDTLTGALNRTKFQETIKRADDAMYEAKKKGKNRVEVSI